MSDLNERYEAWKQNRDAYSKQEETGPLPTSNEWQWSDDEAVDLLHEAMSGLWAANNVIAGQHEQWLRARQSDKALNDLVKELTFHADAMRGALLACLSYTGATDRLADRTAVQATVEAYDNFVKEC